MGDFGTYMTIFNNTSQEITLNEINNPPTWGTWIETPASTIGPNSSANAHITDDAGPAGSESSFSYQTKEGYTFNASFQCGYESDNYGNWTGEAGTSNQSFKLSLSAAAPSPWYDSVPASGHPLTIHFTIDEPSS
jgi:hypothetical protein